MSNSSVPFRDTTYFSDLICDYLDQKPQLKEFYNRFPKIESFRQQIEEKVDNYNDEYRETLVAVLNEQYSDITTSQITQDNIQRLSESNTFTVVTGHQLNLFTGPLYFFYKIVSTINLCKKLSEEFPENHFVPIYWMATEDHDFEEINFFNFEGRKVQWSRESSGGVGRLNLKGLEDVFEVFSNRLNKSENADYLRDIFRKSYLEHDNLAEATRFLVNELFQNEGLVILDGDSPELKSLYKESIKKELLHQKSHQNVVDTNEKLNSLEADYKIQVTPREINLFYLTDTVRERIIELEGTYYVNDTDLKWSKDGILEEVEKHPERFSPNVIMRPVFQETILPNLCYIGGGGELAYWLQLKSTFQELEVTFPILLLRNSALIITSKEQEKLKKLNVSIQELFVNHSELKTLVTKRISEIKIDFSPQKEHLKSQFKDLYDLAEKTDGSFRGAVAAQEKKQINGLEHLEQRLLKAQKRKLADYLERVIELQNDLFPNGSLQERNSNFSEFYLRYGEKFKQTLLHNLDPLNSEFLILQIED